MSHTTNTELLERAAYCIDYFEGKLPAQLIETALDNNDLEMVAAHVAVAESEINDQELCNDCI